MNRFGIRLAAATLAALMLAAGMACGSEDAASPTPPTDDETAGLDDPGLIHVHGLDVEPATGTIYAATHTGLFRIADGKAERVGDRFQDTMGFTIDGNGRFLGSGHPDLRDLRSGKFKTLLGLVESTDQGRTWKSLSLAGAADFHALQSAHGRVYGYNVASGAFMVSKDGRQWETRSTLRMTDFAVDPADPERLVAALGNAVVLSTDGGRTWSAPAAPPLLVVTWPASGQPVGVSPVGDVFRGGAAWEKVGALGGEPEALYGDTPQLLAAIEGKGILKSTDAGKTWTSIVKP
ncbi:MAG: F510_1955 family glycosylhydrolase [Tepidiformaceae bacterium]